MTGCRGNGVIVPATDNASAFACPMSLIPFLAVFVGAGCGALLRWGLGIWLNPVWPMLPLGTLAANLGGGLVIGMAMAHFTQHPDLHPAWRLLVVTGFLGGLTTFSTFSAEGVALLQRHHYGWALLVAGGHLAGSLLLTGVGILLARWLWLRA